MLSLADTQARLRRALVEGDTNGILPLLIGGSDAGARLAVHRRHYETSLAKALLGRFPATTWLLGGPRLGEAARAFVHAHPPSAPCIAEYGSHFAEFLSTWPACESVPYVSAFARLEWHVGQVAVATDRPPVAVEQFAQPDSEMLMHARLTLQPGLRYVSVCWPVDEIMTLYLTETAPERFALAEAHVRLEVRGARGEFQINRLDAGDFMFRVALQEGRPVGDALECALDAHDAFDPGVALAAVIRAGLVIAIAANVYEEAR